MDTSTTKKSDLLGEETTTKTATRKKRELQTTNKGDSMVRFPFRNFTHNTIQSDLVDILSHCSSVVFSESLNMLGNYE